MILLLSLMSKMYSSNYSLKTVGKKAKIEENYLHIVYPLNRMNNGNNENMKHPHIKGL